MSELARRGAPGPAVRADLAGVVEVVERDEVRGERMQVGRRGLRELGERRVAVALREVAEHLIVGAVLLDDVDDVLDVLPQAWRRAARRRSLGAGAEQAVGDRVRGERGELRGVGTGRMRKPAFSSCRMYWLSSVQPAIAGVDVAGVRSGDALAVDHVEHPAVVADADRVRVPAGGNQADDLVAGVPARVITATELGPPLVT